MCVWSGFLLSFFRRKIHLGQMVDPSENTQKVKSINCLSDFNSITKKSEKITETSETGSHWQRPIEISSGDEKYCLSRHNFCNQNHKKPANLTYKDLQVLEWNIKLPSNHYMNWNSTYIGLSIKTKKIEMLTTSIGLWKST